MLPQNLKTIRERVLKSIRRRTAPTATPATSPTTPTVTQNATQKNGTTRIIRHSSDTGDWGEDAASAFLQKQGLRCLERNWRAAGRYGTEIDLIMQDAETLVFVEVRLRKNTQYGGAGGSINWRKQQKIIRAAQQYIQRFAAQPPPCRFDTVLIHVDTQHDHQPNDALQHMQLHMEWLRAAFAMQ